MTEKTEIAQPEATPKMVKVKLNEGVHHIHNGEPCANGAELTLDAARAKRLVDKKRASYA